MSLDIIAIVCSIVCSILVPALIYFLVFERRLTRAETKIEPFWRIVEERLPELLHSPEKSHAEIDALLEKFSEKNMTPDDLSQLHQLMAERLACENPGRQVQYMLLMARIEQMLKDGEAQRRRSSLWKKTFGLSL